MIIKKIPFLFLKTPGAPLFTPMLAPPLLSNPILTFIVITSLLVIVVLPLKCASVDNSLFLPIKKHVSLLSFSFPCNLPVEEAGAFVLEVWFADCT